jgi:hypothetical protein
MHAEAYRYVRSVVETTWPPLAGANVIEFGALNINGSVRELFEQADVDSYTGLDIVAGPGVDIVGDATSFTTSLDQRYDVVVCCEVFEHLPNWHEIIERSAECLVPRGLLILTMAGLGRDPHSAVDGGPLQPGEHYANIDGEELVTTLHAAGFDSVEIVANIDACDLYASARRKIWPNGQPE